MTARDAAKSAKWYADDGDYMRVINEKLRERPHGPEPTDEDRLYDGDDDPDHEPAPYCADLWDDPERVAR